MPGSPGPNDTSSKFDHSPASASVWRTTVHELLSIRAETTIWTQLEDTGRYARSSCPPQPRSAM